MSTKRALRRFSRDVGDLLDSHEATASFDDFAEYRDDPVGFVRDVLDGDPWSKQVEIAETVRDEPLVAVKGCHAGGKDWIGARLALWWVYARRGLVVLTGPTR